MTPKKPGILVSFGSDPHGTISAHTWSSEISLPFGVFKDYTMFKIAMDTVVGGHGKLIYNTI